MDSGFCRRVVPFAMALLLVGLIFSDASGQKRRTKKSRRVTNPVTTTASTAATSGTSSDPEIISTAEENSSDSGTTSTSRSTRTSRNSTTGTGLDVTQEKVDRLSAQVSALNEKLSLMEQQQRTLVDLERLSRAETRAEMLRAQLRDAQAKEAELQSRLLQLDYELQPSVIERTLAASGSTRPEDLREQRRRQLETEKSITQTQLNQITTSRARLESAVANADLEADRLRARIDSALEPMPNETTSTEFDAPPTPTVPTGDVGEDRPR